MSHNDISLYGYGSDIAGANRGSGNGAAQMKKSAYLSQLTALGIRFDWGTIVQPDPALSSKVRIVQRLSQELSLLTASAVLGKKFFTVIGGDHTSAIGTWSGVHHAKHSGGPIGLIWIDAHLDSHTPETSDTGNLHGMPLACLLGKGDPLLTGILTSNPKLLPENICVIGARSYEEGELQLLQQLNVRIFFMDEVKSRGMPAIMQEAVAIVTKNTSCFGITIDIDSIDPPDAPGTGVAEPDGIPSKDLCASLSVICNDPRLIGAEIVEFDPSRDKNEITEKLIINMIAALTQGKTI